MIYHSTIKNYIGCYSEFDFKNSLQFLMLQQFMSQLLDIINSPKKKNKIIISISGDDNLDELTAFQEFTTRYGYKSRLDVSPRSEKLIIDI